MRDLDATNQAWGNLTLSDTTDLVRILDKLQANESREAKDLLEEFIARRGYDENAGDWCENCRALIEGGTPFSRYCDTCADACACRYCDCKNTDEYTNGETDTRGICAKCFNDCNDTIGGND